MKVTFDKNKLQEALVQYAMKECSIATGVKVVYETEANVQIIALGDDDTLFTVDITPVANQGMPS